VPAQLLDIASVGGFPVSAEVSGQAERPDLLRLVPMGQDVLQVTALAVWAALADREGELTSPGESGSDKQRYPCKQEDGREEWGDGD
jgi:hypothetical protein